MTRETADGEATMTFQVEDNGIGMTREQRERVFDAFTQADESPTHMYGGTGLGLAIVQHLCTMMGGTITVHREFGRGSIFTIQLPVVLHAAATRDGAGETKT